MICCLMAEKKNAHMRAFFLAIWSYAWGEGGVLSFDFSSCRSDMPASGMAGATGVGVLSARAGGSPGLTMVGAISAAFTSVGSGLMEGISVLLLLALTVLLAGGSATGIVAGA